MAVDIIDLNFNENKLFREIDCDYGRYNRAINLYSKDKVRIENVEEEGNDTYFITAFVDGTHDSYKTELKIKKGIVKECICNCEDFKNGFTCKHIIATVFEVANPQRASTVDGENRLKREKEELEQRERKKARRKQAEREYNQKYYGSINTLNEFKNDIKTITENTINLKSLYENVKYEKSEKQENQLATSMKLQFYIRAETSRVIDVNFKIGQSRMYVLNDISEFYEAYKNNTELYYGKQLRFIPKRENFDEKSQKLFDFIIKYAEMVDYSKKYNEYGNNSFLNKSIYLSGDDMDKFFDEYINDVVLFETYGKEKIPFQFLKEKLDLYCILTKEKVKTYDSGRWLFYDDVPEIESEEYLLKPNIGSFEYLESNKRVYISNKGKIYAFEKNERIMKILHLFSREDKVLIPKDRMDDFEQYVFPQIAPIKIENIPEQLEKQIQPEIVNQLSSKIMLDVDESGNLLLKLKFCYLNYEFNILENGYKKYVEENKIVRDIPAEKEVLKRIFMDGFEYVPRRTEFIMKNLDDMYEFLSQKIDGYMRDYEVLATDKFKNKQIKQPKISNIGIKINNGLLEVDLSKINIDINEIKNVLKSYNIKKKYYRLKSGDFLDLSNNNDLNLLDEMTETLDIDYSKIKNGTINLPMSRSFYLEKLSKDVLSTEETFISKMSKEEIMDLFK